MKFLLTVFPGLSGLAEDELQKKLQMVPVATARVRGSELLWVQTSDPAGLLELDLVEDVFVSIDTIKLTGDIGDLKHIAKIVAGEGLSAATRVYEHLTGRTIGARAVFRVVVQADDVRWRTYRRLDMQRAAETSVLRARSAWRLADVAPVELWLHQEHRNLSVTLRLSNWSHRARGGREEERKAALRPTIAAAMVFASGLGDEDVFLDPMCGSGTILLERATAGRYGLLLGGDIDPVAVKAALANFGPRHQPRRIVRMDARHLPFEDASVDKLVTNLPWGRQIGNTSDLPGLYGGVVAEAARVVRTGGAIVLLTGESQPLIVALRSAPSLRIVRSVEAIEVLGRAATMFIISRR